MRGRLLLAVLLLACLVLAVGGWVGDGLRWVVDGLRWAPGRPLARDFSQPRVTGELPGQASLS